MSYTTILQFAGTSIRLLLRLRLRLVRLIGFDPFQPHTVHKAARLLRQAATAERQILHERVARKGTQSNQEAASWAWIYFNVCEFIDRGFAPHVRQDFDRFRHALARKLRKDFSLEHAAAEFLESLAARLPRNDLDPGFVMPNEFSQFEHTMWPANAAMNRPVVLC